MKIEDDKHIACLKKIPEYFTHDYTHKVWYNIIHNFMEKFKPLDYEKKIKLYHCIKPTFSS